MNKSSISPQTVLNLAAQSTDAKGFIKNVDSLLNLNENKGRFFFQVGNLVYANYFDSLAIEAWKTASVEFIYEGDTLRESNCYINVGSAYQRSSNYQEAIEYYQRALIIKKNLLDKSGLAAGYLNIALSFQSLGSYKEAIDYCEKSLQVALSEGNNSSESACYLLMGAIYRDLGETSKAIQNYERALSIKKEIGDTVGEMQCYGNLGIAYNDLGDVETAIIYHEMSLAGKETGDLIGRSRSFVNLGHAHSSLSDFQKAIGYYEQALAIKKTISDKLGESICYTNLGNACYGLNDYEKAIEYHEKSLEIKKQICDRSGESNCYGNLGNVYTVMKDLVKAIDYHKMALDIKNDLGEKAGVVKCLANLGNDYYFLGDYKQALHYFQIALDTVKDIGNIEDERLIYLHLGRISVKINNLEDAYHYFKRSIDVSELVSGKLVQENLKMQFHDHISVAYKLMVPLCLKLGRESEAFEYVERCKSRAIMDLLAATKIKPVGELSAETKKLLEMEEEHLSLLREIQIRNIRKTRSVIKPQNIQSIRNMLADIYDRMEEISPEYVSLRTSHSFSFEEIIKMLSLEKKEIILLEYFLTDDEVIIFVIKSSERKLHVRTVTVNIHLLNQMSNSYKQQIVNNSEAEPNNTICADLSSYLIKPVAEFLTSNELVYFVPYGFLHLLPMHTILLCGEPLIKTHAVAYLPSASILKFLLGKGSGQLKTCVSFGVSSDDEDNPTKKIISDTAEGVANLFGVKAIVDGAATKSKVLQEIGGKDVIHFTCHGYFGILNPLSSGLELFSGERLTARELFEEKINAEIVTLGACETGINRITLGDEVIGLTRAFMYAGAPSVIGSLWEVYAEPTRELICEFYKALSNGANKAVALQHAQITTMKKYPNLIHWAPFVLIGRV